jgi:hypothetical protein
MRPAGRGSAGARGGTAWAAGLTAAALAAAGMLAAAPATAAPGGPERPDKGGDVAGPALVPDDGTYLEGTVAVAATPVAADDSVTHLTVDGTEVPGATTTVGTSTLSYTVGSNSTESRYGNYLVVNGEHRIDLPDAVSERVDLEVPNEHLRAGENVVDVYAGTFTTSCGENHDDFVLSEFGLTLLGEIADGEENELSYAFGDGSCGSNTSLLKHARLSFFVQGDPQRTTGLAAELDTTTLAAGEHTIEARTAAGGVTTHTVTVNNAPAGAPAVQPADGTLAKGTVPVTAARPAAEEGGVTELLVDGGAPPARETLGTAVATLSFDVGSNSIDDAYHNHLLVNGARVEIGGDWADERVQIAIPGVLLVPGENTITIVSGDYRSSCGVNRDDFVISNVELALDGATVTGHDVAPTYPFGDGNCAPRDSLHLEAETRWTVDADGVTTVPALGTGDAVLAFDIGSNSMEARYHSYLLVNDRRVDMDDRDYVSERVEVVVPNEYLSPGANRVEVVTGTLPGSSCGDNRDDYALSAFELTPATGTASLVSPPTTYNMGDGNCGSSVNPMTEVDLTFVVDAEARGLRVDLDTTRLADGDHQIAATSTTGETATRLLRTDNTGPEVASSTPAAGATLTSSVPLAVEVTDASGVTGEPGLTLDGEPVAEGDLVGPGLGAGEHTLAVSAVDGLGNASTHEVVFTSAGIPDVPADLTPEHGSTDVGTSVTLSARVAEPDGGDVTATFSAAEAITPQRGFQGTATEVPTTLRVAGEKGITGLRGLEPGDDATLASPASGDVTFQRFDVTVPRPTDAPVVRWEGQVDPERLVTLHVWDTDAGAWEALGSARGAVDGATVLTATVADRHLDGRTVHVMVTGEDPFADDIDPGEPDAFEDPADYDFAMVHFTDTQYLSEGAVEHEAAEERAVWASAYTGITEWIAANADERKISYVAHTGDITENNHRVPTTPQMEQQILGEFQFSSSAQRILDEAGVPNGVVAGNHDNRAGTDGTLYNEYFGPDRYEALSADWEHASYGGPWREGDNENHYDLFSAGGLDFVVVGLSYGVTREEAEWAAAVFERFSDRNGILLTHDYLEPSTNPDGRGANLGGTDGPQLYRTVVETNPNVFLVLAGHRHGVGTNVRPQVGQVGHGVVELLADYQFYTVPAGQVGLEAFYEPDAQLRLGASFFRMLQFDVERGEMSVDTYSPLLGEFGATEYDADRRFNGLEDNMVLPVDLTSRTTSIETDTLAVYVPTREIGAATVASGEVASVEWADLRPGTTYAWVVTARSAGGGVTTAEPSAFVTRARR